MKFSVTKANLLQGIQSVQNVVSIRSTLPILANVLLKAEKGSVQLTTSDLDLSIRASIEAEVAKGGGTTLPVKRLSSIARELPDSPIDVTVAEKDVATLKCGASVFKIMGLSQDEFPVMPKPEGKFCYRVEQNLVREMLRRTAYAASGDETRHILNGVLFSFRGGKLTLVATDGRRLALVEHELEVPKEAEADLIVPTKTVNELQHILGDSGELSIHLKENQILFEFGRTLIASKLVDGSYPNYRQVIPSQTGERIVIEREALLASLRRVALVASDRSNATKLTFSKNELVISMSTPDVGEAQETLPVKYNGKELTVAFNPDFMMDPLKNIDTDEVFLELTDDMSPGVIKCEIPFLYVLMPMRLG